MATLNIGLSVISTGTVTATNGSAVVTASGNGSSWQITNAGQTFTAIGQGDALIIGSFDPEMILSGDSATQITLQRNWPNATQTNQPYKIIRFTAAEALSSSTLQLINRFLTLGLQANPFVSALIAGGARLLQIVQSGTDILFKIGPQASPTVVTDPEMAALVTAIKIDATGKVTFPLGAPEFARPNLLTNGSLAIVQRGTTQRTSDGYLHDHWFFEITSGTAALDSTATVPSSTQPGVQRSARITANSAGTSVKWMQGFETGEVHQFKGKRVTFSAYVRMQTGFSGNLKLFIETGDTASAVKTASATWSATTPITGLGTNTAGLIAPTTSYQLVSVTVDLPSSITGLRVGVMPEGTQASGNIWFIAAPKLEFGSVVTDWIPEAQTIELAKCQRYYRKSYPQATAPAAVTTLGQIAARSWAAAGGTLANIRFDPPMHKTPTITIYNPSDGNTTLSTAIRDVTAAANIAAAVDTGTADNGFAVRTTATPAAGNQLTFHYAAEAELV